MLEVIIWLAYIIACLLMIIFIMALLAIIIGFVLRGIEWIQEEKEWRNQK